MTTNERMNLGRYSHFHTNQRGVFKSPFDRGMWQNLVDFMEFRCLGYLRPIKDDWMNKYEMEEALMNKINHHHEPVSCCSEDREPLLKVV